MEHIKASREDAASPTKSKTFTGTVLGESKLAGIPGVMMNAVHFAPSARTHWHSHQHGQVLSIIAGQGYVGTRDGDVVRVAAGDTVWAPPEEEHYHGATAESFLLHDAVSLGKIEWLDEVGDHEYGPSPR